MEEYICDKCYELLYSAKDSDGDIHECNGTLRKYDRYLSDLNAKIGELLSERKCTIENIAQLYFDYILYEDKKGLNDKQYKIYITENIYNTLKQERGVAKC